MKQAGGGKEKSKMFDRFDVEAANAQGKKLKVPVMMKKSSCGEEMEGFVDKVNERSSSASVCSALLKDLGSKDVMKVTVESTRKSSVLTQKANAVIKVPGM
jgi:hypothetical protein